MTGDVVTHFADEDRPGDHTLCDRDWTAIVMNRDKATCETCIEYHAQDGWTFPLPPVVV